jgi:hypothetical protein
VIADSLAALATPVERLELLPGNPRRGDVGALALSLQTFGQMKPIVANADGTVIAGNHTLEAARQLGWEELAVVWVDLDPTTAHAYALADNRTAELGGYDDQALAALIAEVREADEELLNATGWRDEDLQKLLAAIAQDAYNTPTVPLVERFGVPPFTILDARQGYWLERKRGWLELGLRGELGREAGAYKTSGGNPVSQAIMAVKGGISVFDPVLCELAYRWFSAPGALVLDPFAGGSVRGVVAAATGRFYHGIELSAAQVEANREQWRDISPLLPEEAPPPLWKQGDSRVEVATQEQASFDFVLSCPPYADLEKYSDDPADISNMAYEDFLAAYTDIIGATVRALKPESFIVWVVADVRDRQGFYRGLVADTILAFEDAGAQLYNDAVLATPIGSARLQAGPSFVKSRKLCRIHQNVLVLYKGTDPAGAPATAAEVAFGAPDAYGAEED